MSHDARPATAQTTMPKRRMPYWDNARFIAITMVVVGHGVERLIYDSNAALAIYLFVYAWHMPAFALISGYFSKATPPSLKQMKKVLTDIVLPYAIMETIWSVVKFLVEGDDSFNPTRPSWTLWFLLALGIFRVILPYFAMFRFPVLLAIVLSVGVGYLDTVDKTFSLSRALGILPFFVLGWKLHEWGVADRVLALGRRLWFARIGAVIVFASWAAIVIANLDVWREMELRHWFFYDRPYEDLSDPVIWSGLARLIIIGLGALLTACFLVLVPRGETWFTVFGESTMYVYLLHSFVLYPLRELGVLEFERVSIMWVVTMVFASIAIAIALSSPLVRRLTRPLIEPRPAWLFVDRSAGHPGQSEVDPTGSRRTQPIPILRGSERRDHAAGDTTTRPGMGGSTAGDDDSRRR